MDDAIVIGIVGKRGYGKTTRMLERIGRELRVIGWDPRRQLQGVFPHRFYDANDAADFIVRMRGRPLRCSLTSDDPGDFAALLEAAHESGGRVLFAVDEASTLCPRSGKSAIATESFAWALAVGRHEHIGVVWTAQRPAQVDPLCFGQCEIIEAFRVSSRADLEQLSGFFDREDLRAIRHLHHFDFYSTEDG